MTDKGRNSHRVGKLRVEAFLAGTEKDEYNKAFKASGCRSNREFVNLLVERFNRGLLEG